MTHDDPLSAPDGDSWPDGLAASLRAAVPDPGAGYWDEIGVRLNNIATTRESSGLTPDATDTAIGLDRAIDTTISPHEGPLLEPRAKRRRAAFALAAAATLIAGVIAADSLRDETATLDTAGSATTTAPAKATELAVSTTTTEVAPTTIANTTTTTTPSTSIAGAEDADADATTAGPPATTTTTIARNERPPIGMSAESMPTCYSAGSDDRLLILVDELVDGRRFTASEFVGGQTTPTNLSYGANDGSVEAADGWHALTNLTRRPNVETRTVSWVFDGESASSYEDEAWFAADCEAWSDLDELIDDTIEAVGIAETLDRSVDLRPLDAMATAGSGVVATISNGQRWTVHTWPGTDMPAFGTLGAGVNNITASGRIATVDGESWTELDFPRFPTGTSSRAWIPTAALTGEVRSVDEVVANGNGATFVRIDQVLTREDDELAQFAVLISGREIPIADEATLFDFTGTLAEIIDFGVLSAEAVVEVRLEAGAITELRVDSFLAG